LGILPGWLALFGAWLLVANLQEFLHLNSPLLTSISAYLPLLCLALLGWHISRRAKALESTPALRRGWWQNGYLWLWLASPPGFSARMALAPGLRRISTTVLVG